MTGTSRHVATIRKNGREQLRISVDEFHSQTLLNLRVWYEDPSGEMRPGKQGLAVRLDLAAELARAIAEAAP